MAKQANPVRISLPRGWPQSAKVATLHMISLAQRAVAYTRTWAVNCQIA